MPIHDGDEVAILRSACDPPSEVVEIATVQHAGPLFIQLLDGRMYATLGGMGLNTSGCLVEARREHCAAIQKRRSKLNGTAECNLNGTL